MKVNQNGKLILTSSSGMVTASNRIRIEPTDEMPPTMPDGKEAGNAIPITYELEHNYPNPFNPATTISFSLPSRSFVSLKVFDALGREVSILLAKELPAGTYSLQWNAVDLPSGVYFYRLQADDFIETKKMILLR